MQILTLYFLLPLSALGIFPALIDGHCRVAAPIIVADSDSSLHYKCVIRALLHVLFVKKGRGSRIPEAVLV